MGNTMESNLLFIHKPKSYTNVDNRIFCQKDISARAKGVFCQILSLEYRNRKGEWTFSIPGICALFTEGKTAITAAMHELEEHGFLLRAQKRGSDGRFCSAEDNLWVTLDEPELFDEAVARVEADGYMIVSQRPTNISDSSNDSNVQKSAVVQSSTGTEHGDSNKPSFPPFSKEDVASNSEGETNNPSMSSFPPVVVEECSSDPAPSTTAVGLDDDKADIPDDTFVSDSDSSCGLLDEPRGVEHVSKSAAQNARERAAREKAAANTISATLDPDFLTLCNMSLRPVYGEESGTAYAEYQKILSSGVSGQQIISAYSRYVDSYTEQNGANLRYAMKLTAWLTSGSGFSFFNRFDDSSSGSGEPTDTKLTDDDMTILRRYTLTEQKEKLAEIDSTYQSFFDEIDRLRVENYDGCSEQINILDQKANRYFNEHKKQVVFALRRAT